MSNKLEKLINEIKDAYQNNRIEIKHTTCSDEFLKNFKDTVDWSIITKYKKVTPDKHI